MLSYDDLLWLRRESSEVSEKLAAYVHRLTEHLGREGELAEASALMEPFPELALLEQRLNAKSDRLDEQLKEAFALTRELMKAKR